MTDTGEPKPPRSFTDAVELVYVSAIPAAAVLAFVTQPLLRLADPQLAFYFGIWLAASVGMLASARVFPPERPRRWVFWAYMIISLAGLVWLSAGALERAAWNDARCANIERAMLHPGPNTRENLADAFQALGCQPQGRAPTGVREGTAAWDSAVANELMLDEPKGR